MAKKKGQGKKGTYSELRLPVAAQYVRPISRRPLILLGILGILLLGIYVAADFFLADADFVSNGPLSSSHAVLEDQCDACHDAFGDVESEKCSLCHEKLGDKLGLYTFASHYLYRSNDFQRLVPSEHETSCAGCHTEHEGREAKITQVGDRRCRPCHDVTSFSSDHPQLEPAAAEVADEGSLQFPHIHHVREVMKREGLEDHERSCLYCHNPRPDGKSFEPISFDRHCDPCHLTATERTEAVPLEEDGLPGVRTLEMIREARDPGTDWAFFMSPSEFRERGKLVSKSPVYHRDPWVLDNLRRLRRYLYDDSGLADLLRASPEAPASETKSLYEEAINTLEGYAQGLRSRPESEVQAELSKIEEALKSLRRALEDPYTPLDETVFPLALESRRDDVSEDDVEEVEEIADLLTSLCQRCHTLEKLTIARVQKDQRVLRRAEFNHRAHIIEVRCLECHNKIPILENLDPSIPLSEIDPAVDRSSIQNLPSIEKCRECHNPDLASERCVTCHLFHPDKKRRSDLLLYVNTAGAG